ncbi:MAG: glycosyltransferase [Peptococcaceae bacterium]|nr:glycosyltransferase [Peptococcaceae bacterium]
MTRVLIASPVRQKSSILKEFLWSLDQMETTGLTVEYAFIDDHDEPSDLLQQFAVGKDNVHIFRGEGKDIYHCDENQHHWRQDLIWKVARYKDRFIQMAKDKSFDYLFLVDSDLVLHPKTLVHLVGLRKDIVSEVFWTRWKPDLPPLPNVWVAGHYRLYHMKQGEVLDEQTIERRVKAFLTMLKQPGTYKVGGLGACTLISRRAISMGISFCEIYNLDLVGEDRHFCVRAAALGLELFADTHYPPYHIYRESELSGLKDYKERVFRTFTENNLSPGAISRTPGESGKSPPRKKSGSITLAMLVRNEAGRYLERVLKHAAQYIDRAVILDDASDDNTVEICRDTLQGIPLTLVSNAKPSFHNEVVLRKQLWNLATGVNPDWILILDADEMFEDRAVTELRLLAANPEVDVYTFRLYDMWDENHYREDEYWRAHHFYRPFMVRYIPGFHYVWYETPLHCGRFPKNITELKTVRNSLRVKHLGWMKPADRLAKYYRYMKLDPLGRYGIMAQYLSILDPKPNLVAWHKQQ